MTKVEGINGTYGWIPFHVVACSSQEFGYGAELLAEQSVREKKCWESERLGLFPIELIIRLHYRYVGSLSKS